MIFAKKITRKTLRSSNFKSRTVNISRVTKVTTGGRRMSISTLVVIGDRAGVLGYGLGNSLEMKSAESKALKNAQNNLIHFPLKKIKNDANSDIFTIHHPVVGFYSGSKVYIRPSRQGGGVISGPVPRAIFECMGVTDVVVKLHGSGNPHNVLRAVISALITLKSSKYYSILNSNCASYLNKTTS